MESEKYNWNLINEVANEFWQFELSYLNNQQITIIQKSIEENTSIKADFLEYEDGFKFDLRPIIENAKTIFELIILIINIVLLYKNTKSDEKLILKISRESDDLNMKFANADDETIKKILKIIKNNYGIR